MMSRLIHLGIHLGIHTGIPTATYGCTYLSRYLPIIPISHRSHATGSLRSPSLPIQLVAFSSGRGRSAQRGDQRFATTHQTPALAALGCAAVLAPLGCHETTSGALKGGYYATPAALLTTDRARGAQDRSVKSTGKETMSDEIAAQADETPAVDEATPAADAGSRGVLCF